MDNKSVLFLTYKCRECTENGNCTKCWPGEGLSPSVPTVCQNCAENCLICERIDKKCLHCKTGYGPEAEGGSCGLCSTTNCEKFCNNSGAGFCDICTIGFGIGINKICEDCPRNCKTCGAVNTSYCDLCFDGFTSINGNCVVICPKNCEECHLVNSTISYCDRCVDDYHINNGLCLFRKDASVCDFWYKQSVDGMCNELDEFHILMVAFAGALGLTLIIIIILAAFLGLAQQKLRGTRRKTKRVVSQNRTRSPERTSSDDGHRRSRSSTNSPTKLSRNDTLDYKPKEPRTMSTVAYSKPNKHAPPVYDDGDLYDYANATELPYKRDSLSYS